MIPGFFFKESKEDRLIRPVISLGAVILAVVALTGISFSFFWLSDTRTLVESIQANSGFSRGQSTLPAETIDGDGILDSSELELLQENIREESAKLNPELDFGASELGESVLGI